MTRNFRDAKLRRCTARWLALGAALLLTACVTTPPGDSVTAHVKKPEDWMIIGSTKVDLNLPLVTPLEIKGLARRFDTSERIEEIYTFHGITGYVKTSRMIDGSFPDDYAAALGRMADFKAYAAKRTLPSGRRVETLLPQPFLNGEFFAGESLSRGYLSRMASAKPEFDNCFVARTAYLMQGYESGERSPSSVDTVVEVLLCGDLPRQIELERMLTSIEVVEDRDAYRDELARHRGGTI